MHLDEMKKLFLDSRKRGTDGAKCRATAKTVAYYDQHLDRFIEFLLNRPEGALISYGQLRRAHFLELSDYVEAKMKAGDWSEATVNQLYRVLRTFFRWVDADEDCQNEGLKGLQRYLPPIQKTPRRQYIPSTKELRQWKNSFDTRLPYEYRNYVITCLILVNGMRNGEICNLELKDLMLDNKYIVADGKTKARLVPITEDMVKLLRGWLRRREKCKTAAESTYVFISKYEPKLTPDSLGMAFRKHREKYKDLPPITPHVLRHAFCTYYLQHGGNMEKLRNISGHKSYESMRPYLHLAELGSEAARAELERVNPLANL